MAHQLEEREAGNGQSEVTHQCLAKPRAQGDFDVRCYPALRVRHGKSRIGERRPETRTGCASAPNFQPAEMYTSLREVLTFMQADVKACWLDLCAEVAICDNPQRLEQLKVQIDAILLQEKQRLEVPRTLKSITAA